MKTLTCLHLTPLLLSPVCLLFGQSFSSYYADCEIIFPKLTTQQNTTPNLLHRRSLSLSLLIRLLLACTHKKQFLLCKVASPASPFSPDLRRLLQRCPFSLSCVCPCRRLLPSFVLCHAQRGGM